jgi:hypothetical protein
MSIALKRILDEAIPGKQKWMWFSGEVWKTGIAPGHKTSSALICTCLVH